MNIQRIYHKGFTIVELLVVIVVIGILVTLSVVSYNGIQQSARDKSVLSDIDAIDGIETDYGIKNSVSGIAYYSGNSGDVSTLGFTPSSGNIIDIVTNSTDYCIRAYNPYSSKYKTLNTAAIKESSTGVCATLPPSSASTAVSLACPGGFIVVPGNSTYGTSDFCVMKYEAKQASSTVPVSQADGTPWASITQTDAINYSSNVADCTGCHLMTDNEWLTIASNVLGVSSNWSGGSVGSGYIYSGHNDYSPSNALAASTDDSDGYYGTGNSVGSGPEQRRTLTLSNGSVIWDFAGNLWEFTSGTIAGGQQPGLNGESSYATKQYNNVSLLWNGLPSASQPANVYAGAGSWGSSQGIGMLFSNYGQASARVFARGGYYGSSVSAGVLAIDFSLSSSNMSTGFGFRVAR